MYICMLKEMDNQSIHSNLVRCYLAVKPYIAKDTGKNILKTSTKRKKVLNEKFSRLGRDYAQ